MKVWQKIALLVAVLAAGVVVYALLEPEGRLIGRLRGEPEFQGKPASTWRNDLRQDEVKSAAARDALIAGKGDAVPVCAWLVEHAPEAAVRARAADALKQMGKDAQPAGATLVAALDDSDAIVRGVALQAVEALSPDLPNGSIPKLVAKFPATEAIRATAKYGPAAAEAIPQLMEVARGKDPTAQFQAIRALGKIGGAAIPQAPELVKLLADDPNDKVREISAEVLGQLGPAAAAAYPQVVPALVKALKDGAWNVRRDAVRSLGQLGSASKSVLADVKVTAKDVDERVRVAAEKAVREIEGAK